MNGRSNARLHGLVPPYKGPIRIHDQEYAIDIFSDWLYRKEITVVRQVQFSCITIMTPVCAFVVCMWSLDFSYCAQWNNFVPFWRRDEASVFCDKSGSALHTWPIRFWAIPAFPLPDINLQLALWKGETLCILWWEKVGSYQPVRQHLTTSEPWASLRATENTCGWSELHK